MKRFLEIKSNSWINSISTLRQNVQWCNGSIDPTAGYCRCTEGLLIVDVHDAAYDPAYGRVFLKIFTFLLITYERTVNQCRLFAESYHRLICHRTVLYSEELIFSHHAFFVKNRCVVNITPRCYILSCDARCSEGQKCQKKRKLHFYDSVYAKCETQKGTNETKLFSDDEMIIFISCRQHIWTVSDIYVFILSVDLSGAHLAFKIHGSVLNWIQWKLLLDEVSFSSKGRLTWCESRVVWMVIHRSLYRQFFIDRTVLISLQVPVYFFLFRRILWVCNCDDFSSLFH